MAGFYENAGDPGNQFGLSAQASATEAKNWANYTFNLPVPQGDGTEYSSKHHATNASTSASAASTAKTAAETAKTGAETAQGAAETAQAAAELAETGAEAAQTAAETAETNAASSASAASTSETNAASSASAASTSETNAASSASAAATSESNASTSETNAATSESNAAASAVSAAASFDSFDDRYLGAKSSAPALDNDGDVLITGALYFDTSENGMYVYSGSAWILLDNYVHPNHTGDVTSDGDGALTIADNAVSNTILADVPTSTIKGRATAGTGDPEDLTPAEVRSLLGLVVGTDVQAYDADTAKLDVAQTWTANQTLNASIKHIYGNDGDAELFFGGTNLLLSLLTASNFLVRDGTTTRFTFARTTGNFTATGNVTAYSDERLKENWTNLPYNFIRKLSEIKSGTYTRTDIGTRQVGVSAQSLREVLPEAVQENEDGVLSVSYGNAALAACVELSRAVVELEARIKLLEGI